LLKIREFSKLCKCSVYTLRYYDQIGILKPSIIDTKDTKSGYRFYDEKQLNDYIEIKDFQSIGFSILEIQSFNSKTNNEILQMIDEKVEQLETKLELSIYIKKKYFGGYEK
jgi:DNA-binding transcriptional MerR regulator